MDEKRTDAEFALPYPISKAYTDLPVHNCLVNTTDGVIQAAVYPAFPWRLTEGSLQEGNLELREDDHSHDSPLSAWELLRSLGAVPEPIPAQTPRE